MAHSLEQALARMDEEDFMARGPVKGSSPPRVRQRTEEINEDESMAAAGIDESMFAQTRYLKQELKAIIQQTSEDQEKRFDERFSQLERRIKTMAKLTDGEIKDLEKKMSTDKEEAAKWKAAFAIQLTAISSRVEATMKTGPPYMTSTFKPPPASDASTTLSDKKTDKQQRTITFGTFPEDTKAETITGFIDNILKSVKADIEESFAYGKKFAMRGAARFVSEEAMWKFMTANAGNHKHHFNGQDIYVNVDKGRERSETDKAREKAVRKLVRTIIEKNEGDGKEIKKSIHANFVRGIVYWNDMRVGEWQNESQTMSLKGTAISFTDHFENLMAAK